MPGILFAGTRSNCGKTTAVCALLTLLRERGLPVSAFKCGPDYSDPLFHRSAFGVPSANLDPFFFPDDLLRETLAAHTGADPAVIEGVMGYYDGTGTDGTDNSTYSVARAVSAPMVLVADGRGASASLPAEIEGFAGFVSDIGIRGVLFNGMTAGT